MISLKVIKKMNNKNNNSINKRDTLKVITDYIYYN